MSGQNYLRNLFLNKLFQYTDMSINKILVTGANGQLGWELSQLIASYQNFEFIFLDRSVFDLTNLVQFENSILSYAPSFIINTAAYTAVDKAELEKELAITINTLAVQEMARIAKENNITFITFSTDYVFSGNAMHPYLTDSPLQPINFYGETKANGEIKALEINPASIIIRTSWVFSSHGNNFVKTMLKLMKDRDSLNIVADQIGRPTYAKDLAHATMQMIVAIVGGKKINGIYHYANTGETTWFNFAQAIKQNAGLTCTLNPIQTIDFPTPAKRPAYSVLDTSKIETEVGIVIPHWEDALKSCQQQLMNDIKR